MFEAWAGSLAIPTEEVRQRFRFDRGFELFERGAMPPSDYHRHIAEGLGLPLDYGDFVAGWNAVYGEPHSSVVSLLERLRRSYRLVAFTNTNELHQEVWPAKYERELVHFDRIFSSCDMGHRKPEAEAFRTRPRQLWCPALRDPLSRRLSRQRRRRARLRTVGDPGDRPEEHPVPARGRGARDRRPSAAHGRRASEAEGGREPGSSRRLPTSSRAARRRRSCCPRPAAAPG